MRVTLPSTPKSLPRDMGEILHTVADREHTVREAELRLNTQTVGVKGRLPGRRYRDHLIGQQRDVMLRATRADGVNDLEQGRPLVGIIRGRRRGSEEPGVIDDDAVIGMTGADRVKFGEHGTLIGSTLGGSPAPVTIEEVQRGNRSRNFGQLLPGVSLYRGHMRKIRQGHRGSLMQLRREFDRDHLGKHPGQRPGRDTKEGAGFDRSLKVQTTTKVFHELDVKRPHGIRERSDSAFGGRCRGPRMGFPQTRDGFPGDTVCVREARNHAHRHPGLQ